LKGEEVGVIELGATMPWHGNDWHINRMIAEVIAAALTKKYRIVRREKGGSMTNKEAIKILEKMEWVLTGKGCKCHTCIERQSAIKKAIEALRRKV